MHDLGYSELATEGAYLDFISHGVLGYNHSYIKNIVLDSFLNPLLCL